MSGLIRLLSVLAVLAMAPGPVVASDFWTRALTDPASRLWTPLPPGSRIAVRPLDPDETGLPDSLLREVEQALTAALLATAPAGGGVASRRDLPVAWEETESFGGADGQRLLADAAVEAVAVPALVERRGGVALSAVLIGVRDGAVGAVLATMPPTELAVDVTRFELTGAETGARRLGVALAEGLRAGRDPASAFAVRVARRGPRSPVADWFAGLVAQHLIRRLAEPPLYVTRSVRRMGEAPVSGNAILALEVWDQGERADFQATAVMNGVEAQATVRIAIASIPAGFRPLTRDGGRVGDGFFQAVGMFTPSMRMDRREVLFAARVLARAALVADGLALGSSQGSGRDSGQGSGAREIAAAMTRLARGIPHEEIWRDRPAAGRGAVQALRARVAPVGGGTAPILEAAVERALYRQGDALSARVLVRDGRAFVAAYAWQADDTVVRISPRDGAARRLEPEIRIDLPGPDEATVTSAPLPESDETVEAIIVVASALPFSADALAPAASATPQGSLSSAAEMSAFLDALTTLDLARTSLAILPYRVRAAD